MHYTTRESGFIVPATLKESGATRELRERINELEFASGNDDGSRWLSMGNAGDNLEFSRGFLTDILRLARITYLKNPNIKRGVNVKADYIFAQTVAISSPDEDINAVLQQFLDDTTNQNEFSSHASRIQREKELQIDGNVFFALIPHIETGRIRMRSIPAAEVTDIITDPNDRHARWYYKREWLEKTINLVTGEETETRRTAYYQDWRYKPTELRTKIGSADVIEGVYIYHVKTGGFSDWKFGVSDLYDALDWARAYKEFLENWSTIVAAYARFAFKVTTTGGKTGAVNARRKLETRLGASSGINSNPAPVTASVFVAPEGNDIEPIRTSGATTSAEDGRRLLLMVASSFGLPETFFGDVSVGTLATASSLDRPTELMLSNRQQLWRDIYIDILQFVIEWAIRAPNGDLRTIATIGRNEFGEEEFIYDDGTPKIVVTFPSIVIDDPVTTIAAITQGATLDGKTPTVIPDLKLIARMVLTALGEADIDETLNRLFPDDASALPTPPAAPAAPASGDAVPDTDEAEADALATATEALREAIITLAGAVRPPVVAAPNGKPHIDSNGISVADINVAAFLKP